MRVLAAAGLALVLASAAAGAAPDRTVTSPGAVEGLARSGLLVAFASRPSPGDCDHVELWSLVTRGVTRFGVKAPCGPATSTGRGLVGPSLSGNRALWLTYVGGNIREWSLWTATATAPKARQLLFVAREVDAPPPVVLGRGSETLLPYAFDRTVTALSTSGARAFRWQAPVRVASLAAGRDGVATALEDGSVTLLSTGGAVIRTYAYPAGSVQAVRLAGVGVLVQHGTTVDIRKGTETQAVTLPAGAKLLDYAEGILLYQRGLEIHGLRVRTGRDVLLRNAALAVLEHNGLSYAAGRRVSSVAWARVSAPFASAS